MKVIVKLPLLGFWVNMENERIKGRLMIDNSWKLIEWKTICLLCPYVDEMFNKKDFESEFNLNYNSFINDIDNLVDITCLVNQWWNEQTSEFRFQRLRDYMYDLEEKCIKIKTALNRLKNIEDD